MPVARCCYGAGGSSRRVLGPHLTRASPLARCYGAHSARHQHPLPVFNAARTRDYLPGADSIYLPSARPKRMKTRKLSAAYKMDLRKKFPNHTEIAYREAVAKLKYLLAESYAPKLYLTKPLGLSIKRAFKENIAHGEEYGEDGDAQSVMSDLSKKEPSTRSKYYTSRLSHFPPSHGYVGGSERVAVPPTELSSFIERQEEYIEQLERESQYCKDELKNLLEKVREVVAENEALHDKNKSGFFKSVLDNYPTSLGEEQPSSKREYGRLEDPEPRLSGRVKPGKPLEGPSIVFESRISELEAQLTQARLELRKAREENQDNLERMALRRDEGQLQLELERALREKRELEARTEELQREVARGRARDADVELRSQRAAEVAQQAEAERLHAEAEVRRLRDELERRQEKLRELLEETGRRAAEEKQQAERRFSQQVEQLSADVATHWEAASKSHLETEQQRREIADLKRDLAQKAASLEDLRKELAIKTSKLQEELSMALADKEAAQEEASSAKMTNERNDRQARQEQSMLQSEINSCKMRLERADADLMHARRENLRLTEEIASLEKEINMNRIVEETRVASQPARPDKVKDEKDKDKELASLIFDLENKQAGGVTDQDVSDDANDATALPSHKKRRVKVDLKVKVIPKRKSAQSEPPAKARNGQSTKQSRVPIG